MAHGNATNPQKAASSEDPVTHHSSAALIWGRVGTRDGTTPDSIPTCSFTPSPSASSPPCS